MERDDRRIFAGNDLFYLFLLKESGVADFFSGASILAARGLIALAL